MVYDSIQKSRQSPGATCSLPCPAVFSTCSGWVPCAHLIRQHLDSVSSESSRWYNVTQVSASHSQDPQVVSSSSSIAKGSSAFGVMQPSSRHSVQESSASKGMEASLGCGAEDLATVRESRNRPICDRGNHSLSLVVCQNRDI